MIRGVIFGFDWILYDPETKGLRFGVQRLLENLHLYGHKLCLIDRCTDKSNEAERRLQIRSLKLERYFNPILIIPQEQEGETPGDFRKYFGDCLGDMGVSAKECLLVSVRIDLDIACGNELGMTTVRYRPSFGNFSGFGMEPENDAQMPHYQISQITRLEELIDGLNKPSGDP